jgi:cytochrome c-type biogenesis protein CcmE
VALTGSRRTDGAPGADNHSAPGADDLGAPSIDELGGSGGDSTGPGGNGFGGPGGPYGGWGGRGPRRRALLGSRRRQIVAGLIILGALAFLLVRGLTNATEYFKTTNQAVAQRAQLGTHNFRIEGTVENNVRDVGDNVDFTIFANGTAVNVVSTGSPPQLFKAGIPVVLDGHWQGTVYASDQIMVKHSASYTEAHPGRLQSQLPAGK